MYECSYEGQLAYHEDTKVYLSATYPAAKIPPVIKVQLNSHNTTRAEKAILDAYRYNDEILIFRKFEKTPYYSFMHDEISKFGHELDGMCLREIDGDCAPFSLPYCLNKMIGGVTGVDTVN